MAKAAFSKKAVRTTSRSDTFKEETGKLLRGAYLCAFGADTWTLRRVDYKCLETVLEKDGENQLDRVQNTYYKESRRKGTFCIQ